MALATASLHINTYETAADGRHSVSVKVYFNRRRKYYRTSFRLTNLQFELMQGKELNELALLAELRSLGSLDPKKDLRMLRKDLKEVRIILDSLVVKANTVIRELNSGFSWASFERRYEPPKEKGNDLFYLLEERAKRLRKEGRISSAVVTECALNSLKEFNKRDKLPMMGV